MLAKRSEHVSQDQARGLGAEQDHPEHQRESVDRVVDFDVQKGGDVLADGPEEEAGRRDPAHDRPGVDRKPRLIERRGAEHVRQVDAASEDHAPGGEPADEPGREVGPRFAYRQVGDDDERHGRQLDEGVGGVEGESGQPAFVPCSGAPLGAGDPSCDRPMSMRGLISSIGRGRITVVFLSEPISTIVCRKRS